MSYTLTLTNGSLLATIPDGTVNTSTSLNLIGRNYAGYGAALNENFITLLENSSSQTAPSNPLEGQLWWDSGSRHLNIWQVTAGGANWKVISSSLTGTSAPSNPVLGDFWWDPTGGAGSGGLLSVYNGTSWIGVGPGLTVSPGAPITSILADSVSDGAAFHTVGNVLVNNKLLAVYSTESASFNPVGSLGGLATIYPGLNMTVGYEISSPTIVTSNITVSSNSTLNTVTANSVAVANDSLLSGNLTVLGATTANVLVANIASASAITVAGFSNLNIAQLSSLVASGNVTSGNVNTGNVSASNTVISTNLNVGALATLNNVAATNTTTTNLLIASSIVPTANLSVNIGSPTAWFNSIYGTSTHALYADLAERFAADSVYPEGTLVLLGGENEITQVIEELSEDVLGVISTKAAYLMNGGAGSDDTHPAVALAGRVPVRVIGIVNKGDRLVSAGNGLARSGLKEEITPFNVIGRAIASKTDSGESTIEAIVRVNI